MMSSSSRTGVYGLRLLAQPRTQRLAVIVVLVIMLAVRAVMFIGWTGEIQWGYDFSAYWEAGERVLAGVSPYRTFQLEGLYSPQQQYLYLYPPLLAVVVAPITLLFDDYRQAAWVWAGLGAAIVAAVVFVLARHEAILARRSDQLLLVAAAFAFAPVVGELVLGNVHLLLLGLLAASWQAMRSGTTRGDLLAGALVGVATLIKVFPGLVVVWLIVTGRVRVAVAAIVAMLILAGATLPITGVTPWLEYPAVLINLGPVVDPTDALAPTVWLAGILPDLAARAIVVIAALLTVVWAARRRSAPISFAIAVVASILIAPAVYQHYLAILVLPMILALRHAPPVAWLGVAYVLLSGGEQESLGEAAWIVNRAFPTLGTLIVVGGLAWFGRSREPDRAAD